MSVLFALAVAAGPVLGDHPLEVPILLQDAADTSPELMSAVTASVTRSFESAGLRPRIHASVGCGEAVAELWPGRCASQALVELSPFRSHDVGLLAVVISPHTLRLSSLDLSAGSGHEVGNLRIDESSDALAAWVQATLRPQLESAKQVSDSAARPLPSAADSRPRPEPRPVGESPATVSQGLSAQHKIVMGAGAAEAVAGITMIVTGVVAAERARNRLAFGFAASDGPPIRRYYRAGGIPLGPVGGALIISGAISGFGSLLFDEESPWWAVLAGHVLGAGALAVALLVEDPSPTFVPL